jgi:translation initiation factor 4E
MNNETKDPKNNESEYNDLVPSSQDKMEAQLEGGENSKKEVPTNLSSHHKLNSTWAFWYTSRKEKDHQIPYSERLKKIASFNTLEDFFKYYMFLKSASEVDRNTDLALFKDGYKPLWENCPNSAFWFIRFKKNDDPYEIDLRWEKLLFALIGEQFEELSMLGAVLSIRGRETIIEVWFTFNKNENLKTFIGQKMKDLLLLDTSIILYFKDNEKSLKDKSTLKNAESYTPYGRKNTNY